MAISYNYYNQLKINAMNKFGMYNVSLEMSIKGESPLEVAKCIAEMIRSDAYDLTYYIQNEETSELFTVDLAEEDVDAVLPLKRYEQFIVNITN